MKRFSETLPDEREFEIAGEVFHWRYPYWEEITAIFDEDLIEEPADGEEVKDLTFHQNIEIFIRRIALFIADNDKERWQTLSYNKDNPIPYAQFSDLYRWLLEVASGRPTVPPSPSESGDGTTVVT